MINVNELIGSTDVLFITLDTLRFDVAQSALESGMTPVLQSYLPNQSWEKRQAPATFTFAAHQAFFAGFLPTPNCPGQHPRLFAAKFEGSETTTLETCVFDAPDIVQGLEDRGYHTVCIGGVGFFNKLTPLGRVLPSMFKESHWSERLGVTEYHSTRNQVELAVERIQAVDRNQRLFLFLNVSALHQPNHFYLPNALEDSAESQRAALGYVDQELQPLFDALYQRGSVLCIITSDHGTAYGEDGYWGHRHAHPTVWLVPYAEFLLRTD